MKEFFEEWNPSKKSKWLIAQINEILGDYEAQGYELTLRQLYYQLVSRDLIPNNVSEYNKVGNVVSRGRLAGLIDWRMIEDRVRVPKSRAHWESPQEILKQATNQYYRDRWKNQEYYIEVWCEKDAVSNILEPVCHKYDVTFLANRGYSSQSAMYNASQRFDRAVQEGKEISIIYFGDHDPSGIDMTRDIIDRQSLFLQHDASNDVIRAALNMDQVEEYRPPENPA